MRVIKIALLACLTALPCTISVHAEAPKKLAGPSKTAGKTSTENFKKLAVPAASAASQSAAASAPVAQHSAAPERVAAAEPATQSQSAPSSLAKTTPPAVAPKKPATPVLSATINLTKQTMTVAVGGATKHVFKISSGRSGYRTPTGTYRPQWLARMHYSKKYHNSPMPHSVFFYKGFAIHATYATGRLGAPASHGCIRLSPANAKKFYRLVQKYGKSNTKISIHGVARDRVYAKKKKRRKKYSTTPSYFAFTTYGSSAPKKRKVKRKVAKKKKKTYVVGFSSNSPYTWPGD